ncbi:GNAT family N-acetyltransferase [Cytobacillus firmus]|uniref:GNAT family N-acetyltransferase n=1 Tax=Cytobacillus firmus TaxID=1399 RepID=UPI0018CD4147|nr:GNAT family N-acetyltransferase [Cytobacillus firmus]MBG9590178.1 acetyltransferase [Cytobacillus firmus]
MDIRKSNDSELKKVMLLSPQAVLDGTLGDVKPTAEKIEQLVEPLLAQGSYYLIATECDVLMGWILIGTSKDQFTDTKNGYIYELFILEEYRGNGISQRLMTTGIDHLTQAGYSEIRLSVYAGNKAIKLYEKLGFGVRTVTMSMLL